MKQILWIDSEIYTKHKMQIMKDGYEFVFAESLDKAAKKLKEKEFCLIITELKLLSLLKSDTEEYAVNTVINFIKRLLSNEINTKCRYCKEQIAVFTSLSATHNNVKIFTSLTRIGIKNILIKGSPHNFKNQINDLMP
ncbi:MAG: hypothetical protein ABIG10_02775 [bacterium]